MTQWRYLQRKKVLERELQNLFDSWMKRDGSLLFGVPDWLNAIDVPPLNRLPARRAFGYEFTPDVEFIVGRLRYVLELKQGDKFEPMALAEVLHHAAWSKRYEADQASHVVPVIVSQYNSWLRLAIDEYLRGVIRYVEVVALEDPANPGNANLWAFEAPLAPWTIKPPPTWLVALDPKASMLHWHHVAETDSWFGLREKQPARPAIMEAPYVWVMGGFDSPVLLWEGGTAKRGELWSAVRSPDGSGANGRYFLLRGEDMQAPAVRSPTWLPAEE
jgi:hypothetical protein